MIPAAITHIGFSSGSKKKILISELVTYSYKAQRL